MHFWFSLKEINNYIVFGIVYMYFGGTRSFLTLTDNALTESPYGNALTEFPYGISLRIYLTTEKKLLFVKILLPLDSTHEY